MSLLMNQFISWAESIPVSDKALLILACLILVINLAFGVIHLLKAEIKSSTFWH